MEARLLSKYWPAFMALIAFLMAPVFAWSPSRVASQTRTMNRALNGMEWPCMRAAILRCFFSMTVRRLIFFSLA